MRNNLLNRIFMASTQQLSNVFLVVLLNISLASCGGGIEGTGDGQPIIIEPEATTSDSSSVSSPADELDGNSTAAPIADESPAVIPDVSLAIPDALLSVTNRSEQVSQSQPFNQQLITISADIDQITDDLTAAPDTVFNAISSGYFDNSVEHSKPGRTSIFKWSADNTIKSLFNSNADRIVYLLEEGETTTVRRYSRADNIVFQATITRLVDGDTATHASLNNNGLTSYLRAYSSTGSGSTTIFTQDPTDKSTMQQREIITQAGTITDIQTCVAATSDSNCNAGRDWTTVTGNNDSANAQFTDDSNSIDATIDLTTSLISTLAIDALPQRVSEAVIATANTGLATEEQILCGLQKVDGNLRAFCLQPLPLESTGSLFEELLSGGELFYRPLP